MCRVCTGASREEEPRAGMLDRRRFLELSGAGIAAALFAGATSSGLARAQSTDEASELEPSGGLLRDLRQASEEYDLPLALLVAVGYVNTRLTMPDPEINAYEEGEIHGYGTYGIMALVKNPETDTVSEASRLTGIPEDELMADRSSNILGEAALLADSMGKQKPENMDGFRPMLAGRNGAKSPGGVGGADGGNELFAEEVMEVLRLGFAERTLSGEQIAVEPTDTKRPHIGKTWDKVKDKLPSSFEKSPGERYAEQIGGR